MNTSTLFTMSPTATDWLIFAIMVVSIGSPIALIVIWAVFFRKKGSHHRPRKHRRHRRVRRQLNPTLAQTGGLPPARSPEPPDVAPSQTP
jgi:hypothetical protein